MYKYATLRLTRTRPPHTGVHRAIPAKLPPGEHVLEMSVEANEEARADHYFRIIV